MRLPRFFPTTALLLAIATAMLAPAVAGGPARAACAMSCCVARNGASCPMHAAPDRPSFRKCRSDDDALPGAARTALSLPLRVDANFERHPSGLQWDVPAASELRRSTEPATPPPEGLA